MGANRSHGNMQPRACARWTLACALLMLLGGAGASDHTAECDFLANFYLKTQLRCRPNAQRLAVVALPLRPAL